ncbi:glycosyltransferase [Flavihumibacter stibioxidans]|uniref:Glycosyltransferase n=1 Tax=Flavihumibacter stibioxidans TaxID=1834163 RepID=A0ABR7M751_9BACT|nr:glycosyltransferase [Flavihumibacter stibioxidans]MBC6490787.1 hypothetical protein [Flavihumibacter stibioxidans]
MNDQIPVSVIIPVFNPTELLWETYESLQRQTCQNFEYVIVNDGSTEENALELLGKLQQSNPRIRIIHLPENKGLPAARNAGIQAARGKYLFFIDGDDLLQPTALEKFLLTIEINPKASFVNSWVEGFGEISYWWKGGFHEGAVFLEENRNTSCFLARREVFREIHFDETMRHGSEDWDFWLHAASKGFWGITVPEFLFRYRRVNGNRWQAFESKEKLKKIKRQLNDRYGSTLRKQGFPFIHLESYGLKTENNFTDSSIYQNRHILFICPWLEIGGADKFNLDLLTGLKKKGWKISIVCTLKGENKWQHHFEAITTDIFYLHHYSAEWNFIQSLENIIRLRKPGIVFISNSMYAYYASPWLRSVFPKIRVVDYTHCEDPGWYNGGYPMFSTTFHHLLDRSFTSSEQLKQWCVQRGANADKIFVRHTNIDTKSIRRNHQAGRKLKLKEGIQESTPIILYVARLTDQKQPLVMIDIISNLFHHHRDFRMVIIGDGPDKQKLKSAIAQSPARDNILYLGSQSNETVKQWMDAADIFFLPSAYEGIALSIFEAMAKELAIVAADTGGQKELVTASCGFLISQGERKDEIIRYTNALKKLLDNRQLAAEMGLSGRRRIEEYFDLQLMIDDMDQQLTALSETVLPENYNTPAANAAVLNRLMYVEQQLHYEWYRKNTPVIERMVQNYRKSRLKITKAIQKAGNLFR